MTQDSSNKTQADDVEWVPIPPGMESSDIAPLAFHDVTCPAREHCANRLVHARSHDLARTGVLALFADMDFRVALSFARSEASKRRTALSETSD